MSFALGVADRTVGRVKQLTFLIPVGVAVGLTGCHANVPTVPAEVAAIQLVSGDNQSGTPGWRLDSAVVVRVLDDQGKPRAGVVVAFTPDDQYSYAEPAVDTTDANGVATTSWRLGALLGEQHLRGAISGGAIPSITASATASSTTVAAITGSKNAWCMIRGSGVLTCTRSPALNSANPDFPGTVIAPGTEFTEVATTGSESRACAVTKAGRVWCFQSAGTGAFADAAELPGNYPPLHQLSPEPVNVNPSFCALSAAGAGYCWGANTFGQLGVGDKVDRPSPTAMATTQPFKQIALFTDVACGLTPDGDVYCWGNQSSGDAGIPGGGNKSIPSRILSTEKFKQIGYTAWFPPAQCGVRTQGGLWCWGETPGAAPHSMPGLEFVSGIAMVRFLTVLQTGPGREVLIGNADTDIHIAAPTPALNGSFLRDVTSPHAWYLLCGTARMAPVTICQSKESLTYQADGTPAPGIVAGFAYTMPPVIGIPVR